MAPSNDSFDHWSSLLWTARLEPELWEEYTPRERKKILKALYYSAHSVDEAAQFVQMLCQRMALTCLSYHWQRHQREAKQPSPN